jgi:NADH:ubiquinone oxidoreductase subunit F (NADH-binding)
MTTRLLAGPDVAAGAERLDDHLHRLGPLPALGARHTLPAVLEAAGLLGRGGAGFPVGRKWASVAARSGGADAVVLANGAEGEPLSQKDRLLMAVRPHLVLDGAELAADAVGAARIVVYVGEEHGRAQQALRRALAERAAHRGRGAVPRVDLVLAPARYVSGEESAAVHFVDAGDARPTTTPPRPYEQGIGRRPTLVQNVESLAHAALIARRGDAWYREVGEGTTRGTALVTIGGAGKNGVREIPLGMSIGDLAATVDAPRDAQALLLGGYFGGWIGARVAWDLALEPGALRRAGTAFGCGVVAFLPSNACGVATTARILDYMAGQSAAQCGPCVFGLRAIADATHRISTRRAASDDLARIERWSRQLAGRGACRHPDGAAGLLLSALDTFGEEFRRHQRSRTCTFAHETERAA